jgi:hypothetical protein
MGCPLLQGIAPSVVSERCQGQALDTSAFYEGAALHVRFERLAIFSARRSSASRSSSGRRTMKEQSRPASTRAIQSKLQTEHRKSFPLPPRPGSSRRGARHLAGFAQSGLLATNVTLGAPLLKVFMGSIEPSLEALHNRGAIPVLRFVVS